MASSCSSSPTALSASCELPAVGRAARGRGWGAGGARGGASPAPLLPVPPRPHLCPATRGCGTWWVPTGVSSSTWSLSRQTNPASSLTGASMGLVGGMGSGCGDWPLLSTPRARGRDTPLSARGPCAQAGRVPPLPPPTPVPHWKSSPLPSPPRTRPFRKLDEKGSLHWDRITRLEKGKIYRQVSAIWVASPQPQTAEGTAALPPGPCPTTTHQPCRRPLALCPGAPGSGCQGIGLVRLPALEFQVY